MMNRSFESAGQDPRNVNFDPEFPVIENAVSENQEEEDIYFYHTDHLGSSSWITYTDGSVTQHLQNLPFDEPFIDQRATSYDVRFKFTGKEMDSETGYQYFGARYYDSDLSVWLSVDPLSDFASDWSPYNYVWGNPITNVDPDGLWGEKKADRKHRKAVDKYGTERVGDVTKYKTTGEHGFKIYDSAEDKNKDGKKVEGSDVQGAHIYDKGTRVETNKSLKNYEMFGADLGANSFQRGMVNLYFLGVNAINFWSDNLGGPIGEDVSTEDKLQFQVTSFAIGKFVYVLGRGVNAGKTRLKIPKGYKRVRGRYSHGQKVFTNGKTYISPDVDKHVGGHWKKGKTIEGLGNPKTRMGSYNKSLTKRIGE